MKITRRTLLIVVGVVVIVVAAAAVVIVSQFNALLAPMATIDIRYDTVITERPDGSACIQSDRAIAKEIMNFTTGEVFVSGGDSPIPDDAWQDFGLSFPWARNSTRNLEFVDSCFFRSPDAPADCAGDACLDVQTLFDYTWVKLSIVDTIQCLPEATVGCNMQTTQPGHLSIRIMRKCHAMTFADEITVLDDGTGNAWVMHATTDGTPNLSVELPAGYTLTTRQIDAPFVLQPFGGGDDCYYNIVRDAAEQAYHQFEYAQVTYP